VTRIAAIGLASLAPTLVIYLLFAFVMWSLDPSTWGSEVRGVFSVVFAFGGIPLGGLISWTVLDEMPRY